MRQIQTRILSMVLVLMLLLTGCGGGPSEAEGAEPSATPNATVPAQDTQNPEKPQETEPAPAVEVLSWMGNTLQIISSDTILAQSSDSGCAILNIDGTVRTWLSDYRSFSPVNRYCFTATSNGISSLFDLNGNVIKEDVKDVWNKCQTTDDPWGLILYTAVERQDFGEKTTTYLMRTDTFENIFEVDTALSDMKIYYDGATYRMEKTTPASGEISWSTLDGTPVEPYQVPEADSRYIDESVLECAPYIYQIDSQEPHHLYQSLVVDGKIEVETPALLKYSEEKYYSNTNALFGLMDFSGNKITDIKYKRCDSNSCGVLASTSDHKTDLYDVNGNFCISSDSGIGFSKYEFPPFAVLETANANKTQTGIYDFEKKEFIFVTEEPISATKIIDKYAVGSLDQNVAALYVYYTKGLHVLVCKNGAIIENVQPIHSNYSALGRFLMQSTEDPDYLMIINVDTGEIVSEFQAHLAK